MSITKYTNIDDINNKSSNEGKFIQADDLFIVSKNEIEKTDFGMGRYDVMEVSVYDINNNLLPQKSGNNVAYIKKGDIQNYLYNITNKVGQKELAINIEKLLNDIGFKNGILKVNINFVKQKVGSENELMKVWIQEVSPSRNEIRILPLKTKDSNINATTTRQFKNLKSLNKDFLYYKTSILDSLNAYENSFLTKIDSYLESKFGKDFFAILRKDFGLSKFDTFRTKIFEDFKLSVGYYLTNKYYNVGESNFGKQSETRFDDFEVYDYDVMLNEIQKILNNCIDNNSKILKRRSIETKQLPKEFAITELQKQIQNNLESFSTFTETKVNVYSPTGEVAVFDDSNLGITYPAKGVLLSTLCKGYDQYGKYADGSGGSYESLIASNSSNCGYTPPPPPDGGSGGGGGNSGGGGNPFNGPDDGPERRDGGLGRVENIR
jgi:hypothetical protein